MSEVYISTKEAGRRLGISTKTVRALLHAGDLKGYPQTTATSGDVWAWKVSEDSIDSYIRRQRAKVPA